MLNNIILLIKYVGRSMFGKCPNGSRKKIFSSHFKLKKSCDNCGINFIENKMFVEFRDKFTFRRGRINCSMKDETGWRWFGLQFSIKN